MESNDQSPSRDKDRLHVRDNLKMAITDAESNKGNAVLRAAGQGLRTATVTASKTAEVVTEKTLKYTEEAWKLSEKYMDVAMEHWKTKMGKEAPFDTKKFSLGSESLASKLLPSKQPEKPIVLRKRRQRVVTPLNWPLFYYMFKQDHSKPDLIWNVKVGVNLSPCLFSCFDNFLSFRRDKN